MRPQFLCLIFYTLLLFSIVPSTVMADPFPSYTPVTAEVLQQTNAQLLSNHFLSLTQSVAKLARAQATVLHSLALVQYRLIFLQAKFHEFMFNLILGLLLLFLLFLCLFVEAESAKPLEQASSAVVEAPTTPKLSEENDVRDEFDFMATEQAIPAKLDLARAYKDMGNIPAARTTLEEVLKKGNANQIIEAQQLLTGLPF